MAVHRQGHDPQHRVEEISQGQVQNELGKEVLALFCACSDEQETVDDEATAQSRQAVCSKAKDSKEQQLMGGPRVIIDFHQSALDMKRRRPSLCCVLFLLLFVALAAGPVPTVAS